MDAKNRLLIAVAITCLIVTALFASFGRNLFFIQFPSVSLAEVEDSSSSHTSSPEQEQELWRIDVTPETVQSILSTLNRPESYYRELSVETLWDGGSSTIYVQHWVDQDYSHIRQVLPSGVVRHDLSDLTTNYFWYEGNEQTFSISMEEQTTDLNQHIPTYETVLSLDPSMILSANYEMKNGYACVSVTVQRTQSCMEQYWVSTEHGLLMGAEQKLDGQLVYRMTGYTSVTTPCPSSASFALPDGEILHQF